MGEVREMEAEKREIDGEPIEMELLSPLTGEFFPDEWEEDMDYSDTEEGEFFDGRELLQYEESIRDRVEEENRLDSGAGDPCNLMVYYDGQDEVKRKVESAVISIKSRGDTLYGCTTLKLREPLDKKELSELMDYVQGQYSDGWGEGFEQREIPVDGGKLYVHFWQPEGFRFLSEAEIGKLAAGENHKRPRMQLLGRDGSIFVIMARARQLLVQNGQPKEAKEMLDRVKNTRNYHQALAIVSEYVETELSPQIRKERSEPREEKDEKNLKSEQKEQKKRSGDSR